MTLSQQQTTPTPFLPIYQGDFADLTPGSARSLSTPSSGLAGPCSVFAKHQANMAFSTLQPTISTGSTMSGISHSSSATSNTSSVATNNSTTSMAGLTVTTTSDYSNIQIEPSREFQDAGLTDAYFFTKTGEVQFDYLAQAVRGVVLDVNTGAIALTNSTNLNNNSSNLSLLPGAEAWFNTKKKDGTEYPRVKMLSSGWESVQALQQALEGFLGGSTGNGNIKVDENDFLGSAVERRAGGPSGCFQRTTHFYLVRVNNSGNSNNIGGNSNNGLRWCTNATTAVLELEKLEEVLPEFLCPAKREEANAKLRDAGVLKKCLQTGILRL